MEEHKIRLLHARARERRTAAVSSRLFGVCPVSQLFCEGKDERSPWCLRSFWIRGCSSSRAEKPSVQQVVKEAWSFSKTIFPAKTTLGTLVSALYTTLAAVPTALVSCPALGMDCEFAPEMCGAR